MDIIKKLPFDLRIYIYDFYINNVCSYEERILLKVTPRKLDMKLFEQISKCIQIPIKYTNFHGNFYKITLKYKPPYGGILQLGDFIGYIIAYHSLSRELLLTTIHKV